MSALCKLIAGSKSIMVASGRFFKLTGCSYVRLVSVALLPNEIGMVLCMIHKMSGQILGEILEVIGFTVVWLCRKKRLKQCGSLKPKTALGCQQTESLRQEQRFGLRITLHHNDYNPGITPSKKCPDHSTLLKTYLLQPSFKEYGFFIFYIRNQRL